MTTTRLVPRYSGVASPHRAAGFSLIELVIVIVILGILAVTALPRFLDVTDEAKKASVEGVSGGFATGVSLVRAQWEAEGRAKQDSLNTVLYDGSRFYLTTPTDTQVSNGELSPGYPMDTSAGGSIDVDPANLTAPRCLKIWEGLLQNPPKATASFSEVRGSGNDLKYYVSVTNNGQDSVCRYYLVNSLSKGSDGKYQDPQGSTDAFMSFSYRPASGQVTTNIN
ncbi:MSHA fimbrial major subunit MshB [Aeromonas hydrophila]|uniref:MSHA fimbrial major subunit MshB n=1 Tax=Aeromonas hydrophila TaxID=644 RepID=UPI0029D84C0F|nr:MSHA fimbrial major subunit MshB [Aeromonas hydrophila]MDX7757471.1 MSHA fimbrial major subunit MshB [Aeromonas hydrophila]